MRFIYLPLPIAGLYGKIRQRTILQTKNNLLLDFKVAPAYVSYPRLFVEQADRKEG